MKAKFKIGDTVRIVKYGALMWFYKKNHAEQKAASEAAGNEIESSMWFGKTIEYKPVVDPSAKTNNIISETEDVLWFDFAPHMVGTVDVITGIHNKFTRPKYSLEKSAWYEEEQLELVESL